MLAISRIPFENTIYAPKVVFDKLVGSIFWRFGLATSPPHEGLSAGKAKEESEKDYQVFGNERVRMKPLEEMKSMQSRISRNTFVLLICFLFGFLWVFLSFFVFLLRFLCLL